jgi:spermidine/putrescine transport system ATP-binding protein
MNDASDIPTISIEHVTKRYGDFAAVHEATFDIRKGEFFSMLGPSGCGKTTMLRMIAGFEEVSGGVLKLEGQNVVGVPPYKRAVNTVFQNYALFPHLSVYDNVAFGPRIRNQEKPELEKRVREMLDIVRLGDFSQRKPSQLSGGQRQRVALARALVNKPRALLLDEPLSALDLALRRQMQFELKRIQRDVGITFVFVTHDQEEALSMSDRIAVMRKGYVDQVGTPEEIYDEPETEFVASFIGDANMIDVRVESAAGGRATVTLPGGRRGEVPVRNRKFAPGDAAVLMIRPERTELAMGEPSDGRIGIPVTVIDVVFQGALERCALRDGEGNEVITYQEAQRPEPARGGAMWLSWEPDSARLLHPDATAVSATAAPE